MSIDLNMNSTVAVTKETVIFEKGEPIQSVALVLKGRIEVKADGVRTILSSGNFLGMYDVPRGVHSFTYTAMEDSVVYGLPISTWDQVGLLLEEKTQYRGLFITSMNYFLSDLSKKFLKMQTDVREIGVFIRQGYQECIDVAEQTGLQPEKIMSIERLDEPDEIRLPEEIDYYLAACKVPLEAQKNYYGGNDYVAKNHAIRQSELLPSLLEGCHYYSEWLIRYLRILILDERNLFSYVGQMALRIRRAGKEEHTLSNLLDQLLARIDETEAELIELAGVTPSLNRDKMEEIYYALLSDETGNPDAYTEDSLGVLDHSLMQIIEYAPIHQKVAADFQEDVEKFLALTDKFSRVPDTVALRKNIANLFFEIYEAVAKKCFDDEKPPMAVKLFLWYGFVSEELLTEEELRILLSQPEPGTQDTEFKVYTLYDWLHAIYKGKKTPSKDEFDLDYEGHLKKQIQDGSITEEKMQSLMKNGDEKVHFEVENLVRYADRVLSGNLSSFVPILCSESLTTRIENSVVTGEGINAAVRKVEKIDYSLFYRQKLTSYVSVDINHFELVKRVLPDFVLFPIYGRSGQMWQDMSGKDKMTPGRILLPIFLDHDLSLEVLKLLAHFRWEKCRSEMGAEWNNYRYPSLTSEYTDYLQFYRKNSDLSPDRKDKVKAQLQQCNNRHREVFTKDYQDWILREVSGAMKLNRVAREILFTYCPPASEIAEGLVAQNSYQEAGKRYMMEKRKMEKSFQVTFRKFEKEGIRVPEEVVQTKEFLLGTVNN